MAFQNLRQNNQIYLLHRDKMKLEIARVTNNPQPTFKYGQGYGAYAQPQMPSQVVDITAEGECTYNFPQLPSMSEIVDFAQNGNLVISCSKDAMLNEIQSMKKKAEDVVASIDENKQIIDKCNEMLNILNPEILERKKQEIENQELRKELQEMKVLMASQRQMFDEMMKSMSGDKPSKNK